MSGPLFYDRIKESTTSTGTPSVALAGAQSGFQGFGIVGSGNTCYYAIQHRTADEWEVGLGTVPDSGVTLARTRVLDGSSGTLWVNLSAGIKDVFLTVPSAGVDIAPPEIVKASVDTPDDEFDSTSLDPKWTVVGGATGTVDLIGTTGGIYDLATRSGWLLVQANNGNSVRFRQDYTLPDGKSMILALSPCILADGAPTISNNEIRVLLTLNDDDTDEVSGNVIDISYDAQANSARILFLRDNVTVVGGTTADSLVIAGKRMYFRIHRSSLTYYGFFSLDGFSWLPLGSSTVGSALNNVWISVISAAAFGTPVPIQAIDWIREGGAGIDPW